MQSTRSTFFAIIFVVLFFPIQVDAQRDKEKDEAYTKRREELVNTAIKNGGITNERVIESVRTTKRHEFVPTPLRGDAYYDMSLPIGNKQTISSPFIVAYMTESLDPQPTDKVLEIGTGSGYQAAILSPLVEDVYSIEIVETLGKRAERALKRLKYKNVHVKIGDGYKGWPEHAPFDKIIVTCSPEDVPQPLVDQLKEGGMLVVPVGERHQQVLYLLTKKDGKLNRAPLRPTLFVPMTGAAEDGRKVLPDPKTVELKNLSFELPPDESDHLPGWFYQRQVERITDSDAIDGECFARFTNSTRGRGSRVLQGFSVVGKEFKSLEVSASVKLSNVRPADKELAQPMIAISFYDASRKPLGQQWLGPWEGTTNWKKVQKSFRIPVSAREAIFRVGLFGATGQFEIDDIQVEAIER